MRSRVMHYYSGPPMQNCSGVDRRHRVQHASTQSTLLYLPRGRKSEKMPHCAELTRGKY